MIPRPLALVIVTVVTVVWAVTITAPLWQPGAPEPNPAIHAVFMVIVGGALSLTRSGNGTSTINRVLGALRPPTDPPAPPPESEQS